MVTKWTQHSVSSTGKDHEYGSDTDEEDPPSDPDEDMLSDSESPPSPGSESQSAIHDISVDAFSAEINDVLSSTNELASSYSRPGGDDRGSDEESEFEVVEDDEEVTEWSKPGPSPLRDASPFRPRKLHLLNRAPKPVRIIPIVRNSRHKYGVDCEDKRKKALYRCHFRR